MLPIMTRMAMFAMCFYRTCTMAEVFVGFSYVKVEIRDRRRRV